MKLARLGYTEKRRRDAENERSSQRRGIVGRDKERGGRGRAQDAQTHTVKWLDSWWTEAREHKGGGSFFALLKGPPSKRP